VPSPNQSGYGPCIHEPTTVIRSSRTPAFHKILDADVRLNGSHQSAAVDPWTVVHGLGLQARGNTPPFFFKENNSKISKKTQGSIVL
jgi:hypothetical protein